MYLGLKYTHIVFVSLSILLFQYRYHLKTSNNPYPRYLKILPHVNDTLLLVTGISLAVIAGFNPLYQSWLMAKIIALFGYIGLGLIAFKSSGHKSKLAYVLASLTFAFIVFTALIKPPFLFAT